MNDVSNYFSKAHYYEPDGLTLSTPSCGCCSETYSSQYDYQEWSVSVDSLEKYIAAEREDLNRLEAFVKKAKAAGHTMLSYGDED